MCASESTSARATAAARATRPVPAVNGDVVVRAGAGTGGKFRFADVSLGGFLGFGGLGFVGLLCLFMGV